MSKAELEAQVQYLTAALARSMLDAKEADHRETVALAAFLKRIQEDASCEATGAACEDEKCACLDEMMAAIKKASHA